MPVRWIYCFLCAGNGRLDIGENYNKFFKSQNIQCPLCQGRGQLAIKTFPKNPWAKDRRRYK